MSLWVITAFFNPMGYRSRRQNFSVFRRYLNAPLAAVELSFSGEFELQAGDADILRQVHGGDVLWQKERLLNLALESLPEDCEAVAWVDADVVFDSDDWPRRTLSALERFSLVQLFSERHDFGAHVTADAIKTTGAATVSRSLGSVIEEGLVDQTNLPGANMRTALGCTIGAAWAARRDILVKHSLYDACIVGGGDRAILSAGLGAFESAQRSLQMNAKRSEHYLRWARPYFDTIGGSIGHVEGRLFHLWHGALGLRQYTERDRLLAHFDPCTDLSIDPNGCWRWASDKPALHAQVRQYFAQRMEDGPELVSGE